MDEATENVVFEALNRLQIELPSWGFTAAGTRFGAFQQPTAARTTEEKFHDAGTVHRLTNAAPAIAVHLAWDFSADEDPTTISALAGEHGVRVGSINPTLFENQLYRFGSLCSPIAEARKAALEHTREGIEVGRRVGSDSMTLWLPDGTNYPGQDSIVRRKHVLEESLQAISTEMAERWPNATFLIEYKPFEPAFYHTDIADWGMAYLFCRNAGPNAKVLVDTGHHLPGCNIEHLVAFLLDEQMLGGFHFNDRKYADDDLTLGSIDPFGVFRIFNQIAQHTHDTGIPPAITYMIDQAHSIKPPLEAMVQTVLEAQKLYAKAHAVDREALARAQATVDVVAAERTLKAAYETDMTPVLRRWRRHWSLPEDPLAELRASGLPEEMARRRCKRLDPQTGLPSC